MRYVPRLVDQELSDRLQSSSAVLVEGPRACGKTSTATQQAQSRVYLDIDTNARLALSIDPTLVLQGETPRLIDEWQIVPEIWDHIRRASDQRQSKGNFILTGSAVPADDIVRHSGAGRVSRLQMRTMSLFEQSHSNGAVKLSELLEGRRVSAPDSGLELHDIIELICRGGWPATLRDDLGNAIQFVRDYIDEISRTDIHSVNGVRHDPIRVLRLLQSLARNTTTVVSTATLTRDVAEVANSTTDRTVAAYLDALRRLFVVEELRSFVPHLRSRSRLRNTPKQHFTDPSIAVAALRANPRQLLADLSFLGLLFESIVVRDLRCYARGLDADLCHYRDNTGLEVDAIVQSANGTWIPIEVKLGNSESVIDEASTTLLKFKERVDLEKMGEPANLVVVTSSGYAYRRDDGVSVVPIGALGP